jgi:hypothetical protein
VIALSVVERGSKPQSGQAKHYKIGISCNSKDWLAQYQDNVKEWGQHVYL